MKKADLNGKMLDEMTEDAEAFDLTEKMLNEMTEDAEALAESLNIIRAIKFDKCYTQEDVVKDLWKMIENKLLDPRKHLPKNGRE